MELHSSSSYRAQSRVAAKATAPSQEGAQPGRAPPRKRDRHHTKLGNVGLRTFESNWDNDSGYVGYPRLQSPTRKMSTWLGALVQKDSVNNEGRRCLLLLVVKYCRRPMHRLVSGVPHTPKHTRSGSCARIAVPEE